MARLLMATVDFLPQLGGVSIAAHHLANALVGEGVAVTVLAPAGAETPTGWRRDYDIIQDREAAPRKREGRVWVEIERPRLISRLTALLRASEYDRALAFHPFYYGPGLIAAARQIGGPPVSVMFHGYELRSQLLMSARLRSVRASLRGDGPGLSPVTIRLARDVDEVLVNSRYTRTLVASTWTKAPIRVIGCGLDAREAASQIHLDVQTARRIRDDARAALGVGPKDFLIGSMGRLVLSKNMADLIRVLPALPQAKGLIVGDGPLRADLARLATEHDVADRVIFAGAVDEPQKWAMMRAMDAFCLLSKPNRLGQVEGFGIVLLEASAAGTPVIAAKAGGMTDVVQHGETGLITPVGDVRALAEALRLLEADADRRRRLVKAAQTQIDTRFNWTAIARRLIEGWRAPAAA